MMKFDDHNFLPEKKILESRIFHLVHKVMLWPKQYIPISLLKSFTILYVHIIQETFYYDHLRIQKQI